MGRGRREYFGGICPRKRASDLIDLSCADQEQRAADELVILMSIHLQPPVFLFCPIPHTGTDHLLYLFRLATATIIAVSLSNSTRSSGVHLTLATCRTCASGH